MTIELPKEAQEQLISSIKRFFEEEMDEEIGDLRALLLLDFCLKEVAPVAYNRGVADAQAYMQEKVGEVDATCFELETGFWDEKERAR